MLLIILSLTINTSVERITLQHLNVVENLILYNLKKICIH